MATRRCEQCGGAMPNRMHRERSENGRLVCDNCKRWPQKVSGMNEAQAKEFQKRAAEAVTSIMRVAQDWSAKEITGGVLYTLSNGSYEASVWGNSNPGTWEWEITGPAGVVASGGPTTLDEAMDAGEANVGLQRAAVRRVANQPAHPGKDTHEYAGHYHRGWAAGQRGSGLERADVRREPNAWYDGYMDAATSRPKWSLMYHRSAEDADKALDSGWTPPRQRKTAHDSGDNALLNHCPFCGSGAITGGSDGSVECDYCHTVFTVQVQPSHPNMPQTIDGQPTPPPGMPAGQPTEMSAPTDPAVDSDAQGNPDDALGDAHADPTEQAGQHDPQADQDPSKGKPPWLQNKGPSGAQPPAKKKVPPQFAKGSMFFTEEGEVLPLDSYVARLALDHADDRLAVLASIREANQTEGFFVDNHGAPMGTPYGPTRPKPEVEPEGSVTYHQHPDTSAPGYGGGSFEHEHEISNQYDQQRQRERAQVQRQHMV